MTQNTSTERPIKKIVLATDFSEASQKAIEYAVWMAQTLKADLKVLHVFDPTVWNVPSPYYFMPGFDKWVEENLEKTRTRGKDSLKELLEKIDIKDVYIEPIFAEGRAGKEIVRVAEELDADLVILGTHGYTGWNRFVLGSVAEFVVRHAHCAVLTIKPEKHKRPAET